MKEKSRLLIGELLTAIPAEYHEVYNELAEYAEILGYTPKRNKTKHLSIDFSKSKVKRTIMKFEVFDNGIPSRPPGLRLKFYASGGYSDIFSDGIRRVIEAHDGKYVGCYGCGRCKGDLEGYTYVYPDGRKVFRCGGELIAVYNWNKGHIDEMKRLIKTQDDFWVTAMIAV
jgi:hypothetical protein